MGKRFKDILYQKNKEEQRINAKTQIKVQDCSKCKASMENETKSTSASYVLPTDRPSIVKKVFVRKEELESGIKAAMAAKIDKLGAIVDQFMQVLQLYANKNVVEFENNDNLWIDMTVGGVYLKNPIGVYHKSISTETVKLLDAELLECKKVYGLHFDTPYVKEVLTSFPRTKQAPNATSDSRFVSLPNYSKHVCNRIVALTEKERIIMTFYDRESVRTGFDDTYNHYAYIPIARLKDNFGNQGVLGLFKYIIGKQDIPVGLDKKQKALVQQFLQECSSLAFYIEAAGEQLPLLNKEKLLKDVLAGIVTGRFFSEDLDYKSAVTKLQSGMVKLDDIDSIKKTLIEVDHKRADIGSYPENYLTDINMGHWELFENENNGNKYVKIELSEKVNLVARPPHMDIVDGGVCAIDFGTKSTVVACFDNETRLQRIGKGRYDHAVTEDDYQNPTVMQIIDFETFMDAYKERSGRPFTRWLDLTVSHQAAQELINNGDDSSIYNSIFSELKQWANDKNRRLQLIDRKGKLIDVKPYLQLKEGDFDPIEIYAYYLGLYINNMFKKIYMDYILSFPVNYEKSVQDKLLNSFSKGLKKALPPSIVMDIDNGSLDFRVYSGASEPAAYAVSALEFYDLEPQQPKERVCYGVFDFGGGTTDFDFGIEEYCERKYQYQIKQFGKGGDVYLGGENILALMAYQVYKDNFQMMAENNIPIALPPKGIRFAGSEALVFDSGRAPREAFLNLKLLAEKLRPIWENKPEANNFEIKSLKLYTLPKKNIADSTKTVNPNVNKDVLNRLIEKRIQEGVDSFFKAYIDAFAEYVAETKVPIHILLAGNSSKHPKVKELFIKAIEKEEKATQEAFQKKYGRSVGKIKTFVLHEPLNNTDKNVDYELLHTGKTGVVFGLIRSRRGGDDVKILDMNKENTGGEIKFPYYLGKINRKRVFESKVPLSISYNQWCEFIEVEEGDENFELYYTEQARCLTQSMKANEVKKVSCKFDTVDANSQDCHVYIRKVKPDTIEYAIGTEEEIAQNSIERIYTKVLVK